MTSAPAVIGKSFPRIDGPAKVTGAARFAGDLRFPHMLHAALIRSPHAHARVAAIDAERALKLKGVKAVATIFEVPKIIRYWFFLRNDKKKAEMFLTDDRVRFVGDPVLAVAAEDETVLAEALDLIRVEYEPLKAILDPMAALTETGVLIHSRGNVAFHVEKEFGCVDRGFEEADVIVEDEYHTGKQKHATLEPIGSCVADYRPDGRITVYSSTQLPHWSRHYLAEVLDLPLNRVRVIKPYTGGAFGGRCGLIHGLEAMCCRLSLKTLKPVRMSFTREEDFRATETRHPMVLRMKTGAARDGRVVANQVDIVSDTGAYGTHYIGVMADCLSTGVGLYDIPNYRFTGTVVYTNTSPAGAFRGYGNPQMNFAQESQMDRIAERLGMDPMDLRLKNYRRAGATDPVLNEKILSNGLEECLEKGAALSRWKEKRNQPPLSGPLRRGIGLSAMLHGTGAARALPDPASAIILIQADGTAELITAAADEGQGNRTVLAQVAAETLGMCFRDIAVSDTDTDITPLDCGTHGSRQAYAGGHIVKKAAMEARNKMLEHAGRYLKAPAEALDIREGMIFETRNPDHAVSIRDLMQIIQIRDMGVCTQIMGTAGGIAPAMPGYYGAVFAEVEVNVETGEIKVLKLTSAFDVGKALNPELVRGQIVGGGIMGIGFALTEGLVLKNGHATNPGFTDYRLLRACDAPPVVPVIVESHEPTGPFGAKGIGEGCMVNVASAVANAVYHAVGVRPTRLSISPEDILRRMNREPGPDTDGSPKAGPQSIQ